MAAAIDAPSRTMPIVLWVLRALIAALFLFAAFAKLTSLQMEVDAFAMLPVGQWFRYLVGLLQLAGGIGVVFPRFPGSARSCYLWSTSGRFSPRSCSCTRTGFIPSSSERSSSPSFTCSATPFANDWGCKFIGRPIAPTADLRWRRAPRACHQCDRVIKKSVASIANVAASVASKITNSRVSRSQSI